VLNKNQIENEEILKKLKGEGFRLTRARKSIVDLLSVGSIPLSLTNLKKNLEKRNVRVDRTTIYREILFLKNQGVICEIPVGNGRKGYKVCQGAHHHHLICIRCNKVEEIVLKNTLDSQEKEIARQKIFKVFDHLLEFYGLCGDCQ